MEDISYGNYSIPQDRKTSAFIHWSILFSILFQSYLVFMSFPTSKIFIAFRARATWTCGCVSAPQNDCLIKFGYYIEDTTG